MNTLLEPLVEAIKIGKRKDAKRVTQEAIDANTNPQEILDALTLGMEDVGRRFKANEIFVPEVLVAARAMKTAMTLLEPLLAASGIEPDHAIVIGTVEGDLHDIGKNLVAMMLKGANFKVVDLGTDVKAEDFIKAADESGAKVIALSALLTTTMPAIRETVEKVKASGKDIKVMIGGAPVTQEFADEIAADGYSEEAASAVDLAKKLVAA
ncbi:cobalamin B12-binding domain-containing protein [Coraliomargarita akajimensis]|uniref:Cobalamin B12-binding domain protein n=1 Tax=Coraliomargarita akajimensis (strain DSM 45221 / IAM 15411 / JCM 23193 / KCTC 12865 / 04OKA010-24) TaxID=583355 RepID=D5EMH1_CORAD|nr:corrinoid protein [Coraliomargarita akajimensis]ADE53377.1 cobalamin B12-binding domain protein [Coraliomargarita akajimensis DSM 45221]